MSSTVQTNLVLKETFTGTVAKYTKDSSLIEGLWTELVCLYTSANRYYHTLKHLEHLLSEIIPVQNDLTDIDAVMFALCYHDAIYDVRKSDNEEASARLASERLKTIGVPAKRIALCQQHINATSSHLVNDTADTDFFTDADLSILGQNEQVYRTYADQIRQEYSIYPDAVYIAGRKKVLEHFLGMTTIFKTGHFQRKYENRARQNLKTELGSLK
jgi:predicted metal-dependent HD superfamily phosphohydrolase